MRNNIFHRAALKPPENGVLQMKKTKRDKQLLALIGLSLWLPGALAETLPDAGSLIRDVAGSTRQSRPSATLPPVMLSGEEKVQDRGIKIFVKEFRITRATLFPENELKALLADLLGKELTLAQLQQAALRISEHYRQRGYFARALLPKQVVQDGVVEILVLESTLGGVDVTQPYPKRAKPDMAKQMVLSQQKIGEPLKPEDVLHGLKLVNETPGYAVTATLQPGAKERETNLMISLEDTPLFNGMAMLDNQGVKATGAERFVGALNANNPSGWGDQVSLMGLLSEGNNFVRGAYSVGLGYSGLRAGVNATTLNYRLIGGFSALKASGNANLYGVTLAYPLAKTNALNLYANAAADNKRFVNDASDANTSDKTFRTLSLSLSGDYLDGLWGGGLNQFSLGMATGRADLAANATDLVTDQSTARTQGDYQKLSYSFARLQKLTDRTGMFLSLSGQLASRNLDSSEKFTLGGPNGVRAYPLGEGSGDQGWLLVSELRYNLADNLQLFGFVDAGSLTMHKTVWAGWNDATPDQPNFYTLSGAGLGLNWTGKDNFMLRTTVAGRLGNNAGRDASGNDSDGTKQSSRLWVQLIKPF